MFYPSENGWSLTLFSPTMKWIISPLQISGFSSCVFPHTPGHRLRWLKGTTSLWCGINISPSLWKESSFPVISLRLSVFSVLLPGFFFFSQVSVLFLKHRMWLLSTPLLVPQQQDRTVHTQEGQWQSLLFVTKQWTLRLNNHGLLYFWTGGWGGWQKNILRSPAETPQADK